MNVLTHLEKISYSCWSSKEYFVLQTKRKKPTERRKQKVFPKLIETRKKDSEVSKQLVLAKEPITGLQSLLNLNKKIT